MENNVNEVKGFGKFKQCIKEHKTEIIGGIALTALTVAGVVLYKRQTNTNETVEFVRDIVRESSLKDAIDTTMNKIKYRETKLAEIATKGVDEFSLQAKQKYEIELAVLYPRLEAYTREYNSITIK